MKHGAVRIAAAPVAALVAVLLWSAQEAQAQGVPMYQVGTALSRHIPVFARNGQVVDPDKCLNPLDCAATALSLVNPSQSLQMYSSSTQPSSLLTTGFDGAGNGLISFDGIGKTLYIRKNGVLREYPFTLSGVVGPTSSAVNNLACWDNTAGSLLKDCGKAPSFGAGLDMTGATDSTAALQAIADGMTSGGLILLPAGTIKLSGTVSWTHGAIIQCAGVPQMTTTGGFATSGYDGTRILTSALSGDVFSQVGADRLVVRDCFFDATARRTGGAYIAYGGLVVGGGGLPEHPETRGNLYRNGYDDLRCDYCLYPIFVNDHHLDFAHAGIFIKQGLTSADYGDGTFTGNAFWELNLTPGTCQAGILAWATGLMNITGNKFNGCQRGIEIAVTYGPTGTTLTGFNSIENQTDRGIYIHQITSGVDYGSVTIADSQFLSFSTQFPANGLIDIAAGTASVAGAPNWIQRIIGHHNHFFAPYASTSALVKINDGNAVIFNNNICDVSFTLSAPPCFTVGGNAGALTPTLSLVVLEKNLPHRYGGNFFYGAIKAATIIEDVLRAGSNPLGLTPAISACGGAPSVNGSDQEFLIIVGSGSPTSCLATFAVPKLIAPACSVTGVGTGSVVFSYTSQTNGTHYTSVTITASAGVASGSISVICRP